MGNVKFNVAQFCQEQSAFIAQERNKKLLKLEAKKEEMMIDQSLSLTCTTQEQIAVNQEIENIYLEKTKSAMF